MIEEGLNGRTSAFDDPLDPILNGKTFLPVCLATHAPIDVVVIMLGTNDVFLPQGITAHYAAEASECSPTWCRPASPDLGALLPRCSSSPRRPWRR